MNTPVQLVAETLSKLRPRAGLQPSTLSGSGWLVRYLAACSTARIWTSTPTTCESGYGCSSSFSWGETVLLVGPVMSDTPTDLPTVLASIGVFVALACLWATYFGGGEDVVADHMTASFGPIRSVRLGMNATYGDFAGLVAFAVGNEQAWYFHAAIREGWVERFVACVVAVASVGAIAGTSVTGRLASPRTRRSPRRSPHRGRPRWPYPPRSCLGRGRPTVAATDPR